MLERYSGAISIRPSFQVTVHPSSAKDLNTDISFNGPYDFSSLSNNEEKSNILLLPSLKTNDNLYPSKYSAFFIQSSSIIQSKGFIPNRSLDTPSPFLIGKMRLSGILPASVRILFLATAISPKPNDRFGFILSNSPTLSILLQFSINSSLCKSNQSYARFNALRGRFPVISPFSIFINAHIHYDGHENEVDYIHARTS